MQVTRRQFLRFAGGASLILGTGYWGGSNSQDLNAQSTRLYSAATLENGVYALVSVELSTFSQRIFPLPFQGHDVLPVRAHEVLVSGRRPSTQSALVNTQTGETQLIKAGAGRHFNGHGCLNSDGTVLFTTENAYDEVLGVIGIRDSKTGQQLGEYLSGGLDPHDIKLMPDGKTLVIANGGIKTHPDFGRRKLNIETMQPSLVYLDSTNGKVLGEYRLPQPQLSIRHITVTPSGHVGVALQYEGNRARVPPIALVAFQAFGHPLTPILSTPEQLAPFNGYLGDVIINPDTEELMATSLLGNAVGTWDLSHQRFKSSMSLAEANGIVLTPNRQVFVSSAAGFISQCSDNRSTPCPLASPVSWDNHLVVV